MEESVRFKPTGGGSFNPLSVYPIGSIYLSTNGTNPAELFGGTWEQISGRFLVGVGANKANTTNYWGTFGAGSVNFPAGELGGEAQHKLTEAEMPKHRHTANTYNATGGSAWTLMDNNRAAKNGFRDGKDGLIGYTGGNQPHNNMPPYLAVYMWVRTA